jgi:hypothetical protein
VRNECAWAPFYSIPFVFVLGASAAAVRLNDGARLVVGPLLLLFAQVG